MEPVSPSGQAVATLGWVMVAAGAAVTLVVVALLAFGLFGRARDGRGTWREHRWIFGGGVVLPVLVITPIAVWSVAVLDADAERSERADLEVEVIGHQYWWEYRYRHAGATFETANELHIPVGEPVRLVLRSDDVIHSFWAPRLGAKQDLVPGRTNTLVIEATEPGVYQGQCAEYCGLQHAKMRLLVVAQRSETFAAWVESQAEAPPEPRTAPASRGHALFFSQGCAACHTVRGTEADGRLGPDLTHVASRRTLAAGVLENTHENRIRWIAETWEVKEGAVMPELPLTRGQVADIVAYLETLE